MLSDLSLRTSSDLKKKWQKTYREGIPFSFSINRKEIYMIGVSIYLSKEKQEEWLKVAKENGFTSILHHCTFQKMIQIRIKS